MRSVEDREAEKRFRGLHYEVGHLPARLGGSRLFWRLPHEARRGLHAGLAPRSWRHARWLRDYRPDDPGATSLRPFIDTRSIFVHIPKSAGLAVTSGLYGRKTGDHRTVADYQLCFSRAEFSSFFKFCFVRNPWSRLLSAYTYLRAGGRNEADRRFAEQHLLPFGDFEEFVERWVTGENVRRGLHFRPQHEFVCAGDGRVLVDFVGRYEALARDYDHVREELGTGAELPVLNRPALDVGDYHDHYSARTATIVEHVYRRDIKLFGYTFDAPPAPLSPAGGGGVFRVSGPRHKS